MADVMASATAKQRFQMQVLAAFAALALLLAAVGLYGVLSYAVTSTRGSIGLRMALGATRGQIFRMVVSRAVALTAAGTLIGLAACVALRSAVAALLFGVGPGDPGVLSGAVVVLFAAALTACWLPARRAMGTDPAAALREE
jgi:putative ABC transport system permease protein